MKEQVLTSDERAGVGQGAGSEGIALREDSMFKDSKAENGWCFCWLVCNNMRPGPEFLYMGL